MSWQLTKYEHAGLLIRTSQTGLLIDPGPYTDLASDLTGIETIVITDEHSDHYDLDQIRSILATNPEALILTTAAVGQSLARADIRAQAITEPTTLNRAGLDLSLAPVDHAPVYKKSPCSVVTVSVAGCLYYPSDSFVGSDQFHPVLALPAGGPWFYLESAIDLAKNFNCKWVLASHDIHVSAEGLAVNEIFIKDNLQPDKTYLSLSPGQSMSF